MKGSAGLPFHRRIQAMPLRRSRGRVSAGQSASAAIFVLSTVGALILTFLGTRLAIGQDCDWDMQPSCASKSGTNPCAYFTCRQVNDQCSGTTANMWTEVVLPPLTWPRCVYVGPLYSSVCYETGISCGTTIPYYDSNCSMY